MKPILSLKDVSKRFGGVIAAQDVTFEVTQGEIHGLIGPNGAGKSTLMNLISGIYSCDNGQIYIDGKEVTNTPSYKRSRMGLGRTFQTPRLLQRSSIRENLMLGIDLHQQRGYFRSFFEKENAELDDMMNKLLPIAGFNINYNDDISTITYGQRKLLEIIRSMLGKPKIMLVDEPAAGLNNKEIENAMALLRVAAQEYNTGVLLIEHSMDMIMNSCSRIVVLNFGRLIGNGLPEEISSNPQVIEAYLGGALRAEN